MSDSLPIELHLERLPRAVALAAVGDDASCAALPPLARQALAAWVDASGAPAGSLAAVVLDQTRLPEAEAYVCTGDWRRVVRSIQALEVRGAPAIGIAGAAAMALAAAELARDDAATPLGEAAAVIAGARPTAVNLAVGVERARAEAASLAADGADDQAVAEGLARLVRTLADEDEAACRAIGAHGAALLRPGSRLLTHCNAGSLATAFYGTALGVAYAAAEQGRLARVYADETRPVGQGARLTAWELARAGVPVTLLCDSMAGAAMAKGLVDAVVVGADRIAANGDVANKVGTYAVAVLARHHGIPLYVAAPTTTIDLGCPDGEAIPIEERDASEVLAAPIEGVEVWNPAFDVTPAALVTAVVTERGAFAPEDVGAACADGGAPGAPAADPLERS